MALWAPAAMSAAESPPVRVQIDVVVQPLVRDLGAADYAVRERASRRLRQSGPGALPALARAAASEDPEVRFRAIEAMRGIRYGLGADWPDQAAQTLRRYGELAPADRAAALRFLAESLSERAVPFLVARLRNGDEAEAHAASEALREVETPAFGRALLSALGKPRNKDEIKARAWGLRCVGRRFDMYRLLARAKITDSPDLRLEAAVSQLLARARAGHWEALERPAEALAREFPADTRALYVRAEALETMGRADRARELRRHALAANRGDQPAHYHAAAMLSELGRRRLALPEWQLVLEMPLREDVYDVNACIGLVADCAEGGDFERAASLLERTLEMLIRMRDMNHPMGILGVEVARVEADIARLRQAGEAYPAPAGTPVEDELGPQELRAEVAVVVRAADPESIVRVLDDAAATLVLQNVPEDWRLLEWDNVTFRYDAGAKRLRLLIGRTPCAPAVPLPIGPGATFGARTGDRWQLYRLEAGNAQPRVIARWQVDYRVRFRPGGRLAEYTDLSVRVEDELRRWDELTDGINFDRLPAMLRVDVTGTAPSGRRNTSSFRVDLSAAVAGANASAEAR